MSRSLLLVLLCIFSFSVQAAPAQPCAALGTVADLLLAGSCFIDDKTISNIDFSTSATGGATALTAGDISLATDETAGNPGLIFAPGLSLKSGAGQTQNVSIGYRVTVNGTGFIKDASLSLQGVDFSGGGSAYDQESLCFQAFGGNNCTSLVAGTPDQAPTFDARTNFPAIGGVDVLNTIHLDGAVTVQVLTNNFSETPEPSTWLLLTTVFLPPTARRARTWLKKMAATSGADRCARISTTHDGARSAQ